MQPSQIAVIWTMYEEQQRSEAASRSAPRVASALRSRNAFGGQFRRFAYRAQLGPVSGHGPA